jgi:hypothetical protein
MVRIFRAVMLLFLTPGSVFAIMAFSKNQYFDSIFKTFFVMCPHPGIKPYMVIILVFHRLITFYCMSYAKILFFCDFLFREPTLGSGLY